MTTMTDSLKPLSSQLAKLHNSLSAEDRERLDDSLLLAEQLTTQKCAEAMCPFCGAARAGKGAIEPAKYDETMRRWYHRHVGEYFQCAAGPIHDTQERRSDA